MSQHKTPLFTPLRRLLHTRIDASLCDRLRLIHGRSNGKRTVYYDYPAAGQTIASDGLSRLNRASLAGLLNVADLTVGEGDFQVLVHVDLLGTQVHDLLRLALDGAHLVDGEAEGESGRGAGIAALADRLLFGTVGLLAGGGQFTGDVGVGLRRFLGEWGIDGTGAALGQRGQTSLPLLRLKIAHAAIDGGQHLVLHFLQILQIYGYGATPAAVPSPAGKHEDVGRGGIRRGRAVHAQHVALGDGALPGVGIDGEGGVDHEYMWPVVGEDVGVLPAGGIGVLTCRALEIDLAVDFIGDGLLDFRRHGRRGGILVHVAGRHMGGHSLLISGLQRGGEHVIRQPERGRGVRGIGREVAAIIPVPWAAPPTPGVGDGPRPRIVGVGIEGGPVVADGGVDRQGDPVIHPGPVDARLRDAIVDVSAFDDGDVINDDGTLHVAVPGCARHHDAPSRPDHFDAARRVWRMVY